MSYVLYRTVLTNSQCVNVPESYKNLTSPNELTTRAKEIFDKYFADDCQAPVVVDELSHVEVPLLLLTARNEANIW